MVVPVGQGRNGMFDSASKSMFLDRAGITRWSRLARAGLTVIAIVIISCPQTISASSYHTADERRAIASEPEMSLATTSRERAVGNAFARLPLRFEACGSLKPARYLARTNQSTIYLSATEATLALRASSGAGRLGCGADLGIPRNARSPQANEQLPEPRRDRAAPRLSTALSVRMQLIGANRRARVMGESQLATRTNYFIGKGASRWRTGVANYDRVRVEQAYRGIDVIYYGSGQQELEYDFKVAPGADLKAIRLRFVEARALRLNETGDLLIENPLGMLRHRKPVAYQEVNGVRKEIEARYVVNRRGEVRFDVGHYDESLPLIIDPVLSYATYFGSLAGNDSVESVALDRNGNAYVAGSTSSSDLQTTPGAFQSTNQFTDVFIAKLNSTGNAAVYVTYLGGSGEERTPKIAVDEDGNVYVTGVTSSADFPTTHNAFQRKQPGFSAPFVAKLNAGGDSLVYGTYLGAASSLDPVVGMGVDAEGQVIIAGNTSSDTFPTTPGAFQKRRGGFNDAFVARLNRDGSALIYATYLGGEFDDFAASLAVDSAGSAYVAGRALSDDFPTTRRAYQQVNKGGDVCFVTKLSAAGDRLIYSTFLGNDFKILNAIAVDLSGNAYVTGGTEGPDLPTTPNAFQRTRAGGSDAFVMKLNDAGTELLYSTYLGGIGNDSGEAIAADSLGRAYVTGSTLSPDFPIANALQSHKRGSAILKSTNGGIKSDDLPVPPLIVSSLVIDPVTSTLFAQTPTNIITSNDAGASWTVLKDGFFGSLVNDPVRSGRLYGLAQGRVYRSINSGADWQFTNVSALGPFGFSALAIDPRTPDTLYLGVENFPGAGSSVVPSSGIGQGVLFKSTDGGISFTTLRLNSSVFGVRCVVTDSASTVYACTDPQGVMKSTDGGLTWLDLGVRSSTLVVDPTDNAILYANGNDTIVKTTDGGASWISTAFHGSLLNIASPLIDPRAGFTLYAGNFFSGFYRSTDGAATWQSTLESVALKSLVLDHQSPSTVYAVTNPTEDAFVTRLDAGGSALTYSTFVGGVGADAGTAIAGDAFGNVIVGGFTDSADFPVTASSYQTRGAKPSTGFVIRIADPVLLRLVSAAIKGKKLVVTGEGFHRGAMILINGVEQETQNDESSPVTVLIARKGGKRIAPGQTVTIRVRDADGKLSDAFSFTRSD